VQEGRKEAVFAINQATTQNPNKVSSKTITLPPPVLWNSNTVCSFSLPAVCEHVEAFLRLFGVKLWSSLNFINVVC